MSTGVLEREYRRVMALPSDISAHLPVLRLLAGECDTVTEFGVRDGFSSVALIAGQPRKWIRLYDIVRPPGIDAILDLAGGSGPAAFFQDDTRRCSPILPTDLLHIDTTHTKEHLLAELRRHHGQVKRWIAVHDVVACGHAGFYRRGPVDGVDHEGGEPVYTTGGLLDAIAVFLAEAKDWELASVLHDQNGLAILRRRRR